MAPLRSSISRTARLRDAVPTTCLVLLVMALAGYRLTLIDRGHFFWGDEHRYRDAEALVDDIEAGEYRAAVGHLDGYACRPAFTLISAIPAFAQRYLNPMLGINPGTLRYYNIASAFNVLLTLGITVCVWGIARAWMRCPWYALLVAAVFSLLCHANVWIRHLMPYSASLLLFLAALWLLSSELRTGRQASVRIAAAGVLSACGYACYTGYYAFVLLNLAVLLATQPRRLRALLLFCGSAIAAVAVFELLAQLTGGSYLLAMLTFSGDHTRIIQGWPAEGYVFVWRYLREVEGLIGVVLFVLFVGCGVFVLWRRKVGISPLARAGIIAAIACYLLHASLSVFTLQTRFYGRILGMYLPFLVCGAVLTLRHIPARNVRRVAACGVVATSCWSFATFAIPYARMVYPADFLATTMAQRGRPVTYPPMALWAPAGQIPNRTVEGIDPDLVTVVDTAPEGSRAVVHWASHEEAHTSGARFIGVNLKWMFNVWEKDHRFSAPAGYRLIAEAPHPNGLRAIGFEVHKPWERKRLRRRHYTVRLYERLDDPQPMALRPQQQETGPNREHDSHGI